MTAQSTIEFNKMYGLPVRTIPGFPPEYNNRETLTKRLSELRKILLEEVSEVDDIVGAILELSSQRLTPAEWSASTKKIVSQTGSRDPGLNALAMLADWLGDLRVYCESEMIKFGLDSDIVHEHIMTSNMTKLDAQGRPIIKDGKVQKGPNFGAPEQLLCSYIKGGAGVQELVLSCGSKINTSELKRYKYEAYDRFEEHITGFVAATSHVRAEEEAAIALAERGCTCVEELDVTEESEDGQS